MHKFLQGLRQRLSQLSLTQRLILSLVVVVIAIIVFSILPGNIALWLQIERQVWLRVEDAQASTQALYDAERTRLKKLAGLVAERPTLYRLVQEADLSLLEPYLEVLKESSNAGVLQVLTPGWQAGDTLAGLPAPAAFLAGHEPYFADFVSLENPPRFFILAVSQIPPATEEQPLLGWVMLARQLNSEDMYTLAAQTGLVQSLIVHGQRVVSSLPNAPALPFDAQAAEQVASQAQPHYALGKSQYETYYIGLMPLVDSQGNVAALSEVALPGSAIRRSLSGALTVSLGIGLLVLLLSSAFLIRRTRTITQPLQQLALAAEQASLGNLEPPGLPHSDIPEINQLARHLDRARRQLRQTLAVTRREMKQAERLLASIREGVIALDSEGRITFINQDALDILGYRAENALHRPVAQIFPPAPGEPEGLQEMLLKPVSEVNTRRLTVLNGQGQPLLLSVSLSQPAPDPSSGAAPERVLVLRDVTEEEALNRLRYNFLANVAHEFRTPLAGIAATTELLVEEAENLTADELSQLVETISLSTLHLQTLVDNLLESTTIEAGVFQIHRRPIQVHEVVHETMDLMRPLFKRRNQTLTLTIPGELPTLWADPNRLTQVLVNLLSNASKFSAMGSTVDIKITQEQSWLTIAVLDAGPGLPAGRFTDLFNRFVTGSQPGETQYGIGLGLSVVKSIVEMHGGQVGATNRPEGGANVWFTIPINPPQEKEQL